MAGSKPGTKVCQQGHSLAEHGRTYKRTRRSRADGHVLSVTEEVICKLCERDRVLRRVRANPGHAYGMTGDEYWDLYRSQDGRCAVCQEQKKLVVDHCHVKKHVRGLLCRECNLLLGQVKDDVEFLQRAIAYLIRS